MKPWLLLLTLLILIGMYLALEIHKPACDAINAYPVTSDGERELERCR